MSTTDRRSVALLTAGAIVVLAGGWLLRPVELAQNVAPLPSETELQELARRAERRALDDMTEYFSGTVRDAERSVVYIGETQSSAVALNGTTLVGGPRPSQPIGPVQIHAGTRVVETTPLVWGSPVLLSALTRPADVEVPVARAISGAPGGAWVIAVWRTGTQSAFSVGTAVHDAAATCRGEVVDTLVVSQPLTAAMAGGGVFDLNGRLLGVVLPCNDGMQVMTAAAVERLVAAGLAADEPTQVEMRYGLRLGAMTEHEVRFFGQSDGLLVRELWSGSAAARAGFRPGDIITALGDEPNPSTTRVLADAAGANISVRRQQRTLQLSLAGPTPPPAGDSPAVDFQPAAPLRINRVAADSAAAAAGLQPGDHILAINGVTAVDNARTRRRLERPPAALWLELERGERRLGTLLRR